MNTQDFDPKEDAKRSCLNLDCVPPTILYSGKARGFYDQVARQGNQKDFLSKDTFQQIMTAFSKELKNSQITALFLGAGNFVKERLFCEGLYRRNLLSEIIVHEISEDSALEARRNATEAMPSISCSNLNFEFENFTLDRNQLGTDPVSVFCLGATTTNLKDPIKFLEIIRSDLQVGDLVFFDFISPFTADPRVPGKMPTDIEAAWFRTAGHEYLASIGNLSTPENIVYIQESNDLGLINHIVLSDSEQIKAVEIMSCGRFEPKQFLKAVSQLDFQLLDCQQDSACSFYHTVLLKVGSESFDFAHSSLPAMPGY